MKVSYEGFVEMLSELNQFIANDYNPNYILEVRAIGGFSMIIHKRLGNIDGPREESRDIDSLTPDYPKEIVDEIMRIGEKHGALDADGWLNNHWNRTKEYREEFEFFIQWKRVEDIQLSNIIVYYADLEALFLFKIRAMDDRINRAHMEPRAQDVIDVVSILRAFEISDLDVINVDLIGATIQYFPYAINYLIENGLVKGTRMEICNEKLKSFDHTEYFKDRIGRKKQTE